ncbi:uncharacterized protein METZ01_LOCUS324871, partial [marine metagenome]
PIDTVSNGGTISFNNDGSFIYSSVPSFTGTDIFSYRVSDGEYYSNVTSVTIVVNSANDSPVAESFEVFVQEDNEITLTLVGYDEDTEDGDLTFEIVESTSHGALIYSRALAEYIYTPDSNYNGEDSFTYHVFDDQDTSDVAQVTITVTPVNDAPVISEISDQVTAEDTPLDISVEVTDVEDDAVVLEIVGVPQHGSAEVISGDIVRYTPSAEYSGSDNIVLQATELESGLPSEQVNIAITVTPVNDAPVAVSFDIEMVENVAIDLTLVGYDEETEDGDLIFEIVDDPSHGTLTPTPGRAIREYTYTPDDNYNGVDSFTYRVFDGYIYSDLATVSITITAVNTAP